MTSRVLRQIRIDRMLERRQGWPDGREDPVNLCGADLRGLELINRNLSNLDLSGADLRDANLDWANLTGVNLTGARMTGIRLYRATSTGAKLDRADWEETIEDYHRVLAAARPEIAGLRQALVEGRVDGSTYAGPCACLVGTIANLRQIDVHDLPEAIAPPKSNRPAERFFLGIAEGDTPKTNPLSRLAIDWLDEFVEAARAVGRANP